MKKLFFIVAAACLLTATSCVNNNKIFSIASLEYAYYFTNLSIATSSSLIASLSPCSTASTIQCSI